MFSGYPNSIEMVRDHASLLMFVCKVGVYKRTKGGGSCSHAMAVQNKLGTKTSRAIYICDVDKCLDVKCLNSDGIIR